MTKIKAIGLDLAKRVFQVHAVDELGHPVVQKRLQRAEILAWFGRIDRCLVGIEACATSTYWAREIGKFGHEVKLIPPAYVKPYVRRQKNDRNDAAAICEAVQRPSMRFVAAKTVEQQEVQVVHRTRNLLTTQLTQLGNALRAHLAEFGLTFPQGSVGLSRAISIVKEGAQAGDIPDTARLALSVLADQIGYLQQQHRQVDKLLMAWHRASGESRRLTTIPGIGVVTASAIIAAIGDGRQFRSSREFAAWVGLVPRQTSSGGKDRLGRISKKGNAYLRSRLVIGASALAYSGYRTKPDGAWFASLLRRKRVRVATVALANKMARMAWAVLVKGGVYCPRHAVNDDQAITPAGIRAA